jgi:hypothetical protein
VKRPSSGRRRKPEESVADASSDGLAGTSVDRVGASAEADAASEKDVGVRRRGRYVIALVWVLACFALYTSQLIRLVDA